MVMKIAARKRVDYKNVPAEDDGGKWDIENNNNNNKMVGERSYVK